MAKEYKTIGWINPSKNNPNVSLVVINGKVVGFLHNATALGYLKAEKKACPIKASSENE